MLTGLVIKVIIFFLGVLLVFWGIWASFESKPPYNIIGSFCAPIGLIIALLSIVLICVPDFFK